MARRLAGAPSLGEAVDALRVSSAGYATSAPTGPGLEQAQRAVASSLALAVRVLAAWLPRDAAVGLRAVAAWFELVNIEDRIAYLTGGAVPAPFELGVLSSAWDAAAETRSLDELRSVLARSAWGESGSNDPRELELWLRLAWGRRVAKQVPEAETWAAGALAIVLATELFVAGRLLDPTMARELGLGESWPSAASCPDLRERLPPRAAWALAGVEEPSDLWPAELAWWERVRLDAATLVRGRLDGGDVVIGAVALLALDALRVNAALAVAARGGSDRAQEVLDALC
ncbi:MAG: hypothetical protein OEW31_04840 [Thermoleophilia bacterium]|nr:hypothetical protein [Thermoleophilia bacterium]MDH5333651.1 hypothetical protein [Thermoleophilia bacterium]